MFFRVNVRIHAYMHTHDRKVTFPLYRWLRGTVCRQLPLNGNGCETINAKFNRLLSRFTAYGIFQSSIVSSISGLPATLLANVNAHAFRKVNR